MFHEYAESIARASTVDDLVVLVAKKYDYVKNGEYQGEYMAVDAEIVRRFLSALLETDNAHTLRLQEVEENLANAYAFITLLLKKKEKTGV